MTCNIVARYINTDVVTKFDEVVKAFYSTKKKTKLANKLKLNLYLANMWIVMFVRIFPDNFPNIFRTHEPNNSRLIVTRFLLPSLSFP